MSRIRYSAWILTAVIAGAGCATVTAAAEIASTVGELSRVVGAQPLLELVRKQVQDNRDTSKWTPQQRYQYESARQRCRLTPANCTISGFRDSPEGRSRVRDHRDGRGVTPPPPAKPVSSNPPRRPVKFPENGSIRDRRTDPPPGSGNRRDRRTQ
jgi:hypothetical protein